MGSGLAERIRLAGGVIAAIAAVLRVHRVLKLPGSVRVNAGIDVPVRIVERLGRSRIALEGEGEGARPAVRQQGVVGACVSRVESSAVDRRVRRASVDAAVISARRKAL